MAASRALLATALLSCLGGAAGVTLQTAWAKRHFTAEGGRGVVAEVGKAAGHAVVETADFKLISFVEPFHLIEARHAQVASLPPLTALGTLMAYVPAQPANSELFVWLSGSTQNCSFYSQMLETVGSKMLTLCLPYDNRDFIGMLCALNNDCFTELRTAALDGDFKGIEHNNIEYRLLSAIQYLAEREGGAWGSFLDTSSGAPTPLWSAIRIAGHSQGAGNAGMVGYKHKVARVWQVAGTCDIATWPEKMAPPITPARSWFGLGHNTDNLCSPRGPMRLHWVAEGLLQVGETPLALRELSDISAHFVGDAHAVVSFIPPPANCSGLESMDCSHDSLAGNVWGPSGSPYGPIWLSLAGL